MKKLFTLLCIALLAVAAQAAPTVKLYGKAGSYFVNQFYPTQTLQTDADGVIEMKGTALTMGYVYAADEYKLRSVTNRATGEKLAIGADTEGVPRCTINFTSGDGVYEFDVESVPNVKVKQVTFTISATGSNVSLISMISVQTHTTVTPGEEPKEVTVDEGETFQIRSTKEDVYFYSVVVNGKPLQGDGYGTWYYTPEQGDVAVIMTDIPNKKVPVEVTFVGEGCGPEIVKSYTVNGKAIDESVWHPEEGTYEVAMGATVAIELDPTVENLSVTVNGEDVELPAGDKSFDFMTFDEAGYKVVISTEEKGDDNGDDSVEQIGTSGQPEVIYNLQGMKVSNPGKGIFIINGKKVVR